MNILIVNGSPHINLILLIFNGTFNINPFNRQPHKMVKHTKTIRRQHPVICLSVFDHFWGLAHKGLNGAFVLAHLVLTYRIRLVSFLTP